MNECKHISIRIEHSIYPKSKIVFCNDCNEAIDTLEYNETVKKVD